MEMMKQFAESKKKERENAKKQKRGKYNFKDDDPIVEFDISNF